MADSAGAPPTNSSSSTCPGCGAENVRLKNVDGVLICDKCASKKFSSKVRKSIQEAFDKQQENQRRDAYNRRLVITKQAYSALSKGNFTEAIQLYEKYLDVLNTRFKTTTDSLHLGLFDSKKDEQEILLATAVFWDLARTLDRVKGKDKEFRLYLKKFVQFSMGTKHMILSAETLRKYLKSNASAHPKDIEQAHTALRNKMGKCFIAGAVYGENAIETDLLRKYRDNHLMHTLIGRNFIDAYYRASPGIATYVARSRTFSKIIRKILDLTLLKIVQKKLNQ